MRALLDTARIALYTGGDPLPCLFARKEERVRKFQNLAQKACLALSAIGFPIAAYHMYLQFGGGAIVPCSAIGPSCSIRLLHHVWLRHDPHDVAYRVRVDTVLYAFAPAGRGKIGLDKFYLHDLGVCSEPQRRAPGANAARGEDLHRAESL